MAWQAPALKVRHVQVRPIKTIHVNPRALQRQERRSNGTKGGGGTRSGSAGGAGDGGPESEDAALLAGGNASDQAAGGRDLSGRGKLVRTEDGAIVVDSSAVGRVTGKNVTINFPPDDPSGRRQFVGVVKGGKPHGEGMLVWESGSRYKGSFKRGDLNGTGSYYWANGTVYTGEWVSGAMHGEGVMTTATGDRYEGAWNSNRKHGDGQYTWSNGDRYDGGFFDDMMHGVGYCSWPNGRIVEVEFEDEFPVVANRAATALWVCFVCLSILFLASLFPSSPLRALHSLWPFGLGPSPPPGRWDGADPVPAGRTGLTSIDWLSQFPYYLHLLLLFANQRLLREFFAQVIWKVAQLFCHTVGPSFPLLGALSDTAAWRCGIALGYVSVCTFFLFSFTIVNAASYI